MNVSMLLDMAADGLGVRTAIGSTDDGLSYEGLRRHARAAAARLAPLEARTVVMLEPNGPLVPVAMFGAAWAGASYAPVNYRLPEAVMAELVERLQPAVTATSTEWLGDDAGAESSDYHPEPDRPAVLLYTSGTSAAPKAAVLGHDHLTAYAFTTTEFGSAEEDEANLLAAPPFHVAGVVGMMTSIYAGRRVVPLPSFSPEAWIETAQRERATHAFVVPTMLARIVAAMEHDTGARVPSMRRLSYGGARMPRSVLERAMALMPETGFINAYGLTETSATVSLLGPEDHRDAFESTDPSIRSRLESAGLPLPGVELRIDVDGAEAPAGTTGEILLRGAQVSGDYVGHGSRRDDAGWLHTGDLGFVDGDGYLFVVGRADDMIIRGGENISPTEIEDALLQHPAVTAAAVVGLEDPEWGERIGAMVVVTAGAGGGSVDELRAWARERLGSLKAPEILALSEELPTTATGKILHREIKERLRST
jgi:acyl-CoA synthetase (AMP-forming)/AMP-acid ligase II